MLWSKQLYYYDVARWLDGDPKQPVPPPSRLTGRNQRWRNFDAFDIMSMPDKWEYPWFAAWDLAFHCVALAHVDPTFAKYQLILICREWFQHPNGALPAYEWSFDDVNPPVQAWATLEVFAIDGERDVEFLRRVFDKLLVNFTWWVNREDIDGSNVFEGGFLGLDNIGPIDRDHLPVAGTLEQSDATAWMALYSMHMATISSVLRSHGQPTQDLTLKFLEHFSLIRNTLEHEGLWDDTDGFFYDRIAMADGSRIPIKVRSMVGVLPVLASVVVDEVLIQRAEALGKGFADPAWTQHVRHGRDGRTRAVARRARAAATAARRRRHRPGASDSSIACSPSTSSSRPTGCARCRKRIATRRTTSRSAICMPPSTTNRPSRRPTCSGGTRTGAAPSGSR